MHVYVKTSKYIYVCVCVYIYMYMCLYVYICMHIYLSIYLSIYMYYIYLCEEYVYRPLFRQREGVCSSVGWLVSTLLEESHHLDHR